MHRTISRLTLVMCCVLAACIGAYAQQLNPDRLQAKVLQGTEWQYLFYSFDPIEYVSSSVELDMNSASGQEFWSIYRAPESFEGEIEFVVSYSDFFGRKYYTQVNLDVVKSIIEAKTDYGLLSGNESVLVLDVLSNDETSENDLEIIEVSLVSETDGTVQILNDNTLEFVAVENFTGRTAFNYTIRDGKGNTDVGTVVINAVRGSIAASDTVFYTIVNTSEQEIILPGTGFVLDNDYKLVHGAVNKSSDISYSYKPGTLEEGVEFFRFVNQDGTERFVEIEVINNQEEVDFVVDDIVYTNVGKHVAFDPRKNDFFRGVIVDYSPELIYGSGAFAYHPPSGFTGVKRFYYKVHDGISIHTGNIEIYVGNYFPNHEKYHFITRKNTPLALEYNIPVKTFKFNLGQQASNGTVSTNEGSWSSDCFSADGVKMVVYEPNADFVGTDEFIVIYCTKSGQCKPVTVEISVVESTDNCNCFGPKCVWSGDTNKDGRVSILDVLPIGYNYGESGSARQETGDVWGAKFADDWTFTQDENGENVKFADANGDGLVSVADTAAISQNYNSFNSFDPTLVLPGKSIPVSLQASTSVVNAGDQIGIDIVLGSEGSPVLDLQGFSFSIQVPGAFINGNSLDFEFTPTEWFGQTSPVITMAKKSSLSRIDAVLVRTDGIGVSGNGRLGTIKLAIIEDLEGIRPESNEIPISISLNETIMTDGAGEMYKIEGDAVELILEVVPEEKTISQPNVFVFPNPSSDRIQFHANGGDVIKKIELFDSLGRIVQSQRFIESQSFIMDQLPPQGIYIAHVTTDKGISVEKIQIIKE